MKDAPSHTPPTLVPKFPDPALNCPHYGIIKLLGFPFGFKLNTRPPIRIDGLLKRIRTLQLADAPSYDFPTGRPLALAPLPVGISPGVVLSICNLTMGFWDARSMGGSSAWR